MDIETAWDLYKNNNWQSAWEICQDLVDKDAQHADAWHIGGVCLRNLKQTTTAQKWLMHAVQLLPQAWEPWYNLALVYQDAQQWPNSLQACKQAEQFYQQDTRIQICKLINLIHLEDLNTWHDVWQNIKNLDTTFGWDLVANACEQQHHYDLAQQVYDQLIIREPQQALWWNNRSSVCYKQNNVSQALHDALQANLLDHTQGWHNMAVAWQAVKNLDMSLQCYSQALQHNPCASETWNNRSVIFHAQGKTTEAIQDANRSLEIDPRNIAARNNRGTYFLDIMNYVAALQDFQQAATWAPDNRDVAFNHSIALFKTHSWQQAWCYWEHREIPQVLSQDIPVYNGQQILSNKKIAVIHEQGYGDSIQFARYIQWLKKQGAQTHVIIPQPLHRLFQGLLGCDHIQEQLPGPGDVDYQVAMMSIPHCMSSQWDFQAQNSRYFQLDADNLLMWRPARAKTPRLQVGIAWRGNPDHKNARNRNINLQSLEPLFQLPCDFHVLHTDTTSLEQDIIGKYHNVSILPEPIKDFSDTAAIIHYCDLVISVDTSVLHLSGALAKKSWALLPYNSCWRWGHHEAKTSPWYCDMTLYRQSQPQDWTGVVKTVTWDLLTLLNGR
jgi:tetratricopeptide (TPR) repeat protein